MNIDNPEINEATATSINKVAITAPATGSTLTIADGATLTASASATVSGTNTGDQTSVTGNAGTATALETARTIGGVSFNGTANIVPATITVADTTDATSSFALFESATGDLAPKTDGGAAYDASTGIATFTGVSASLNGTLGATTPAAATVTDLVADTAQFDAGTGSGVYMPSGLLNWDTTPVGNVGTGEDDLITYTLPANTLSANDTGLHVRCMGTGANNANTKTIKLFFGGTTIDTRALITNNAQDWVFELWIKRTGASAQTYWYEWSRPAGNSTIVSARGTGSCTETDTSTIVIKCTGNATSNDDIIQEQQIVKFL